MPSRVKAAILIAVASVLGGAATAQAQITGLVNSNVEGFFGATSDTFQQAEGPSASSWGVSGPGFYPITGLPAVPALYPTFPSPVLPLTTNISMSAPFAHAPSSPFTDGQTTATYSIIADYNAPGTNTADAFIDLGVPGAVPFTINQPSTASGYAYEQVNFAAVYSVGPGGLTGGVPGPRPFAVSGSLATGGWAQFGAEVNYWWLTVTPGTTIVTSTTLLGSLQYNFQATNFTGPFSTTVNHSGAPLAGATGFGFLMLTGDAFIAGDPFSLTVYSVPEPSSLGLACLGLAALAGIARRRRQ